MQIPTRKYIFRKTRFKSNPYRVVTLLVIIIGFLFVIRGYNAGEVKPFFMPTATPTRTINSYAMEGEAHFQAGNLSAAITAYQQAVAIDPNNAALWSELARIQTYSMRLLTTDAEQRARMEEAQASIKQAIELAPDDATVNAIKAFVYDWSASSSMFPDDWQSFLAKAEQAALKALQFDNQNTLALAYYAEILTDQQKWVQAQQYINQALAQDDNSMDVHRVNAYVLETLGDYQGAIDEYIRATEIAPNLTFLYLAIGANYRQIASNVCNPDDVELSKCPMYITTLEYFSRAVEINNRLGVQDPIPYLSIAKTYSQMGEFLAAALNVRKALAYSPNNPDVYGQLGIIYFKSKNYEGSVYALRCAILGCDAAAACFVRNVEEECSQDALNASQPITGMALSPSTVVYYYTYGSVLAGLHRSSNGYCEEAMQILKEVRDQFSTDDSIMSIVESSESICINYGYSRP